IKDPADLVGHSAYPYTGVDGVCKYLSENAVIRVLETVNIIMGAEDELKYAVGVVRPVVWRIKCCNLRILPHCCLDVVGYGEENSVPYWLIKNSWAADWGLGVEIISMKQYTSYEIVPQKEEENEGLRVSNKENTSFTQVY
nr:hypothetical protein [Tanacetum cinerariifolium]